MHRFFKYHCHARLGLRGELVKEGRRRLHLDGLARILGHDAAVVAMASATLGKDASKVHIEIGMHGGVAPLDYILYCTTKIWF